MRPEGKWDALFYVIMFINGRRIVLYPGLRMADVTHNVRDIIIAAWEREIDELQFVSSPRGKSRPHGGTR